MANPQRALRDGNYEPTLIGVSSVSENSPVAVYVNPATGAMLTETSIDASDIEIGAVEIKNSSDDTRATVGANGLYVDVRTSALAAGPINGQAKIAVTGTRVQLGSNTLINGVIITAKSTNAAAITVGGSTLTNTVNGTGNGSILEAGMSLSWAVTNTNTIYINGTAGDIISFSGS